MCAGGENNKAASKHGSKRPGHMKPENASGYRVPAAVCGHHQPSMENDPVLMSGKLGI